MEPRGFEPLTSAVQSQYDSLLDVSRVSKIPVNSHILCLVVFARFQNIYSDCCTVAAKGACLAGLEIMTFCSQSILRKDMGRHRGTGRVTGLW
jgi:hypothetical protein